MFPKSNNKYPVNDQNIQNISDKKESTFKVLYEKIRKNIKTSFTSSKMKKTVNKINSKKLTKNPSINNTSNNIDFIFTKKNEDSRNYFNNNMEFDNNKEDIIYDYSEKNYLNKTQKNVELSSKSKNNILNINNGKTPNNSSKKDNIEIKYRKITINNNSNKENYSKNNIKYFSSRNKRMKSKKFKIFNIRRNLSKNEKSENNINKNKKEKNGKNCIENKVKLLFNKRKIIPKEELFKNNNIYEKINSERLSYYHNDKLNKIIHNDYFSEMKNKNKNRMNSQRNVKLNDKKFENFTVSQMKIIKKTKFLKQITNLSKKNHSMKLNKIKKKLFLNDAIRDKIKKNNKFVMVNIFNCRNINNKNETIQNDRYFNYKTYEKKNSPQNNNNYYNKSQTYINFCKNIDMNSTIKNKNEKESMIKYSNFSLYNCSSEEKRCSILYSKPISRLKNMILNSPSEKNIENNLNNIKDKYYKKNDFENNKENYSINNINNNNFKDLLISIKILNQIINTQKKIINDYIKNEINLKKEIEQKNKEIQNYKDVCLKLIFFLKSEKEINTSSELNKKRILIQNQLIKENNFLRKIMFNPKYIFQKTIYKANSNDLEMKNKSFFDTNIDENENENLYNCLKLKRNHYNSIYDKTLKENMENKLNYLYNNNTIERKIIINNNKKREKSYEKKNAKKIKK